MNAISRFLLFSLSLSLTTLIGLATLFSYQDATHEIEELFDTELAQMARVLQSLVRRQQTTSGKEVQLSPLDYRPFLLSGDYSEGEEATPLGHRYEAKIAFMVWTSSGKVLLSSFHSQSEPFPFRRKQGYNDQQIGNYLWHSFTLDDPQLEIVIEVGQREDVRHELISEIVGHALLPLLLTLPLLCIVIWIVVRWGLSPLRRIAGEIEQLNAEQLQPLNFKKVPEEVLGVVGAVNHLIATLQAAFNRERQFTADAAHELRTPLAGLRVQVQNLLPDLNDSGKAKSLLSGIDRLTRIVEQLLTLARLEHQPTATSPVRLAPLLREVVAEQLNICEHKRTEINLNADEQLRIIVEEAALRILIRNIVDNALRYTPDGGQIRIEFREDGEANALLTISDTGPGIPAHRRKDVLQRFVRLAGQEISGSGLGLPLVAEIVRQQRGSFELCDSPLAATGLSVEIRFPRC